MHMLTPVRFPGRFSSPLHIPLRQFPASSTALHDDHRRPLSTTHRPDPASLLHFIQTLCSAGRSAEAHHRLLLLFSSSSSSSSSVYTDHTYNALVNALVKGSSPVLTLRLLLRLCDVKPFCSVSLSTVNKLVHRLSEGNLDHAHRLVFRLHCTGPCPDTVTYTVLVNGYACRGDFGAARKVFDEILERNICPNLLTWSVLIKAALKKRAHLSEGRMLMGQFWLEMRRENGEKRNEESVRNAAFANLIQCLCREALFHEVFRIAEEMPHGDCITDEFAYSQFIDSLCRYGQYHCAIKIVYLMIKRGLKPSSVCYNSIIHGLCLNGDAVRAYQLLREGDDFGYTLPEVTYKALVEALCKENDVAKAKDVLEIMLGREIDTETKTRWYNIFLTALHVVQNPSEQLDVLVRMLERQHQPDTVTLNTIIHGFCKVGKVDEARKIMHDMIEGTFPSCVPDVVTFTMVIRGLLDTGQSDEALDMLHNMAQKHSCAANTVTYNTVIKGLFDLKKVENALGVFDEMLRERVPCDSLTYTYILKGLFEADRVEAADRFWNDVVWPSGKHDEFVYAAVLRGFCRGEKFDQACDFLNTLIDKGIKPGVVNYNILIDYACKKGLKGKAYLILNQMRRNGLKPDAVTWRTLNHLHNGSKFEMVMSSNVKCKNNKNVEDLSENTKVGSDESVLHCQLDDSMDGFVDPSLSTEQVERTCDVPGDVSFAKHSQLVTKEPLSRTARRVFGLL